MESVQTSFFFLFLILTKKQKRKKKIKYLTSGPVLSSFRAVPVYRVRNTLFKKK